MWGIIYARDRCGHQRALAVEKMGLAYPRRYPKVYSLRYRWRRETDLPAPEKGRARGQDVYINHLAGSPAEQALEQVLAWLDRQTI